MKSFSCNKGFDSQFAKSNFINFYPYVGEKYPGSSPGILILGESHYLNPDERYSVSDLESLNHDSEATRTVFSDDYFPEIREDGSNPNQQIKCYRHTAAMISGKDYHFADDMWPYLAFYNFFQKYVGFGAKGKDLIDEQLIEDSRRAFYEVLDILKPELVIVWGKGPLYENWVPQDEISVLGCKNYLYRYNGVPDTAIWHIPHPSQGFSYKNHHRDFQEVLALSKLDISGIVQSD